MVLMSGASKGTGYCFTGCICRLASQCHHTELRLALPSRVEGNFQRISHRGRQSSLDGPMAYLPEFPLCLPDRRRHVILQQSITTG